jgi:hypothetical protein
MLHRGCLFNSASALKHSGRATASIIRVAPIKNVDGGEGEIWFDKLTINFSSLLSTTSPIPVASTELAEVRCAFEKIRTDFAKNL